MRAIRSLSVYLVFAITLQVDANISITMEEAESKVPVEAIAQGPFQRKPANENLRQQEHIRLEHYGSLPDFYTFFPRSFVVQPSFKRYLLYCTLLC